MSYRNLAQLWHIFTNTTQIERRRAARAEHADGEKADEGIHDSTEATTQATDYASTKPTLLRHPC